MSFYLDVSLKFYTVYAEHVLKMGTPSLSSRGLGIQKWDIQGITLSRCRRTTTSRTVEVSDDTSASHVQHPSGPATLPNPNNMVRYVSFNEELPDFLQSTCKYPDLVLPLLPSDQVRQVMLQLLYVLVYYLIVYYTLFIYLVSNFIH